MSRLLLSIYSLFNFMVCLLTGSSSVSLCQKQNYSNHHKNKTLNNSLKRPSKLSFAPLLIASLLASTFSYAGDTDLKISNSPGGDADGGWYQGTEDENFDNYTADVGDSWDLVEAKAGSGVCGNNAELDAYDGCAMSNGNDSGSGCSDQTDKGTITITSITSAPFTRCRIRYWADADINDPSYEYQYIRLKQHVLWTIPASSDSSDPDLDLSATANVYNSQTASYYTNGRSVTLSSNTTSVCTIVSNKVHFVSDGSCSITGTITTDNADPKIAHFAEGTLTDSWIVGTNSAPVLDNTESPTLTSITSDNTNSAGDTVGDIIVVNSITDWTDFSLSPSAANNNWTDVAYGNGVFVAVGYTAGTANQVMTSPDGVTWTARTSAADNYWYGITYGNGLFVAVAYDPGTGNRVMTSADGITWTSRTNPVDSGWLDVVYAEGQFVAVAFSGAGDRVMTSPDGITWTARTESEASDWRGITHGNGMYVAVANGGTNRVMTSPDGITWTSRSATEANDWRDVVYANGLFVAVAYTGTNRVMTSPDGITWTARSASEASGWLGVTVNNGLFVAVAYDGTNRAMTSPDGITWTSHTADTNNFWFKVASNGELIVAVSLAGTGGGAMVAASALSSMAVTSVDNTNGVWQYKIDAGSWTTFGTPTTSTARLLDSTDSIRFVPGAGYIGSPTITFRAWDEMSGISGGTGDTSTNGDGTAFSTATDTASITVTNDAPTLNNTESPVLTTITEDENNSAGNTVADIIVNGSIADADEPCLGSGSCTFNDFVSGDTTGQDLNWQTVKYGNGLFVAVSKDLVGSGIITSPDGVTWTTRTEPEDRNWMSVAYGNGTWVAVAKDGANTNQVMTSTDGTTWVSADSAVNNDWKSVTYGNGLFVAVAATGTNDQVMTSPDGTNWASRTTPNDSEWQSITFGNGMFVAVALDWDSTDETHRIMWSIDGINWTAIDTSALGINNDWHSVTYGNGTFVAVAYDDDDVGADAGKTIMTSSDGLSWTTLAPPSDELWYGVTYGNGLFVAVSGNGSAISSPDGTNWTARTAATANSWRSVAYGDGRFVAISNSGTADRAMVSDWQIESIAVTNVDNTDGHWEFDSGSGWTDFGTPSTTTARLLDSTDSIRFVPDGDVGGAVTMTFRAWDESTGTQGSTANTTTNGGTSAFSSDTDTAQITFTAVNDVPVATGNTVVASEDVALVIGAGDFNFTDVEGDALVSVVISGLTLNGGTLTHSG
ncbi:MAG: hypothetical protein COA42_19020, partial [Alteromonadaceae bacterium]